MRALFNYHPEYFLFKYFWLLIFLPEQKYVFFLVFLNFVFFQIKFSKSKWVIKKEMLLFLLWSVLCFLAVILNLFSNVYWERLVADLMTPMVWVLATMHYDLYATIKLDERKLKKYVLFNFLVFLGIAVFYLVQNGKDFVFLGRHLAQVDYLVTGIKTRLTGFMHYATLNTTIIVVSLPLIFSLVKKKEHQLFFLLFSFVPVYLGASRIGLVTLAIVLLGFLVFYEEKRFFGLKLVVALLLLPFLLANLEWIYTEMLEVYSVREASNVARNIIYAESIDKVIETNVLFGYGISEYSSVGPWLGSHSSYISFFYKSGFVGIALIFLAFAYFMRKSFQQNGRMSIVYFVALFVFFIYETIDPIMVTVLLFFSSMGLWNHRKLEKEWNQRKPEKKIGGKAFE